MKQANLEIVDATRASLRDAADDTPRIKPKYVSVADGAAYSGLSESFLRKKVRTKELRSYRAGRAVRLRLDDIDSLLREG